MPRPIPWLFRLAAPLALAAVAAAQTGVPAIDPVADRDIVVLTNDRQEPLNFLFLHATNAPTQYTATGVPPHVFFNNSGTSGGFSWYNSQLTGGAYTVTVMATNAAGTSAPMTFHWTVHPSMIDWLRPDKASYTAGDTITFTTAYSAPVVVTGTPYLQLWGTKRALYAGGSGTERLTFTYQVTADDPAVSGYVVFDIVPGGGAITTVDGVTANLHQSGFAYQAPPTFSVVATPAPPPVTVTPPPVTPTPPPVTPPPPPSPTKSNQTITFTSPVSAIVVGQPIALGATSSAGLPLTYTVVSGDATLSGNVLTPLSTATLVVRAASAGNDTVNPAVVDVSFGNPQKAAQAITLGTTGGTVPADQPITLAGATSSGLPLTYAVISGPATIRGATLTFTGTGAVVVRASQAGDATYAAAPDVTLTFTANPVDRLVNLSSRLRVAPDAAHTAIAGFVVTGDTPKSILIRAIGPGLVSFGVADAIAAPQLQLVDSTGRVIATNAGWNNDPVISATANSVGAFPLATGSKDAAVLATLAPGAYTAQVLSATAGSVLIEVYDGALSAAVPTKQLVNLSTRGAVDAGGTLIGGFVVNGAQAKRVLIRGIGPGLSAYGVAGVLPDPIVTVRDAAGNIVAQNDDWETPQAVASAPAPASRAQVTAANSAAGAFALQPGAKDAAVVLTLAPGAYTAVVAGANGIGGAALVEVYEVNAIP